MCVFVQVSHINSGLLCSLSEAPCVTVLVVNDWRSSGLSCSQQLLLQFSINQRNVWATSNSSRGTDEWVLNQSYYRFHPNCDKSDFEKILNKSEKRWIFTGGNTFIFILSLNYNGQSIFIYSQQVSWVIISFLMCKQSCLHSHNSQKYFRRGGGGGGVRIETCRFTCSYRLIWRNKVKLRSKVKGWADCFVRDFTEHVDQSLTTEPGDL